MLSSSILNDVKLQCNVSPECDAFDEILIMDINVALADLYRVWERPLDGIYQIEDVTNKWEDFMDEYAEEIYIKNYICYKVRMMFDPPSGAVAEAMKDRIKELEFNMQVLPCMLNM